MVFKATGKTTVFDGFLKAYKEGGRDGEADDGANKNIMLKESVENDAGIFHSGWVDGFGSVTYEKEQMLFTLLHTK